MKFRRIGPYKRNLARSINRRCKTAEGFLSTFRGADAGLGFIDGITIYRTNRLNYDKRQLRRMRRTHGRIMRAAIIAGAEKMREAVDNAVIDNIVKSANLPI